MQVRNRLKPLHDGTLPLHSPSLHVNVLKPNKSNPVRQENETLAPWVVSFPCMVPLAGTWGRSQDFSSTEEKTINNRFLKARFIYNMTDTDNNKGSKRFIPSLI